MFHFTLFSYVRKFFRWWTLMCQPVLVLPHSGTSLTQTPLGPRLLSWFRGERRWSCDSYNELTFQEDREVWIQAKGTALWTKLQWAQGTCKVFNKAEHVSQLKWPPLIHLVLSLQLTSLACEVSCNHQFWLTRWSWKHYVPVITQSTEWSL